MRISQFNNHVNGNWSIVEAAVENKVFQGNLFYAVPKEFDSMICRSNADAFFIAFIQLAAFLNEDMIIEERPVSEKLKENVEKKLLPAFAKMHCGNTQIRVCADTTSVTAGGKSGATGISLGVDCFYTLLSETPEKISYCLSITDCPDQESLPDDILQRDPNFENRREVSSKLGKKMIPILTNVRSFSWNMARLAFEQVHTFAHLSAALVLMNGIREYYYSTGYSDDIGKLDFADSSHYDCLISDVIDYPSFKMYTSGGESTRLQKTERIAKNKIVQRYLDVCFHNPAIQNNTDFVNCTKCSKCLRTAISLEMLGELDNYAAVFDLELYRKNRAKNWGEMCYRSLIMKDDFSVDILHKAKEMNYDIPIFSWLFFVREGIGNQIKKIKRMFSTGGGAI